MQLRKPEYTVNIHNAPSVIAKTEIPENIRKILLLDEHIRNGSFSVTELLDHPRCVLLRRKYPDMVVDDVHSLVSSTAGKAVHHWFNMNLKGDGILTEQKVLLPVPEFGVTVSGILDMAEFRDGQDVRCVVSDFKFWKTWHWIKADFTKLVWQLNLYYLGLCDTRPEIEGHTVLRGLLPFSDWNRGDAERFGSKYPEKPFMVLETEPLELADIRKFVKKRIESLVRLCDKPESHWPDATPEDVWQTPSAVRVIKEGGSRAVRGGVFKSDEHGGLDKARETAEAFQRHYEAEKGCSCNVKVDLGERKRCAQYCPVAAKCSAYNSALEECGTVRPSNCGHQMNCPQ